MCLYTSLSSVSGAQFVCIHHCHPSQVHSLSVYIIVIRLMCTVCLYTSLSSVSGAQFVCIHHCHPSHVHSLSVYIIVIRLRCTVCLYTSLSSVSGAQFVCIHHCHPSQVHSLSVYIIVIRLRCTATVLCLQTDSEYGSLTSPDGAVVMPSATGLVATESHLGTGSNPERVFKGPFGRCKATTPSSFSLTSDRVNTNY